MGYSTKLTKLPSESCNNETIKIQKIRNRYNSDE